MNKYIYLFGSMDQEKIGKIIADRRKKKGLTQRELGELVGVGYRAVSKWETGITMPDISTLNLLSDTLDISLDELLKGKKYDEVINNASFTSKRRNIIPLLVIVFFIMLVIGIIFFHNNKVYTYILKSTDTKYFISGNVAFNKKDISINIDEIALLNNDVKNKEIKNYQYQIVTGDVVLYGYGYGMLYDILEVPQNIKVFIDNLAISYNNTIDISRNDIVQNGITLKIWFLTVDDKELNYDINMSLSIK